MAKNFYTERDIEDMVRRGERTLVINDDVVLTDLAYETAHKLNVELVQQHDTPPGVPIRPYFTRSDAALSAAPAAMPPSARVESIKQRVKNAVKERLGSQVEDAVLDRIIERVAADLELR
jgi:hypothetical protein